MPFVRGMSEGGPPDDFPCRGVQPKFGSLARLAPRQFVLRGHDRVSGEPVEVPLGAGLELATRRPARGGNGGPRRTG